MPARTDEAEREAGKGGELDGGQNATHARPRLAWRERPAGQHVVSRSLSGGFAPTPHFDHP